jgi:hypothetical protein
MRTVLSAVLMAGCLLALAGSAVAAPIPVDLRVEGANGRALTADRYFTDSTRIKTAKQPPACNGSGAMKQLPGATALGALVDGALVDRRLDPLLVSDEFDFGLMVCGAGGSNATGASSFWLYKVNHSSPTVGGEAYTAKAGDDVLWYFVDGTRNSGDELVLTAPTRVQPGTEFSVTVSAYDMGGIARPMAGVTVAGGGATAVTDASGSARMSLTRAGTRTLRATLDPNIPSAPTKVCVNSDLSKCAAGRPGRIWGGRRGERITGTSGKDLVRAAGGSDRIAVRRGSVDTVRCGRGRDTVIAGRRDKVARDCEVVRRRGRQ